MTYKPNQDGLRITIDRSNTKVSIFKNKLDKEPISRSMTTNNG